MSEPEQYNLDRVLGIVSDHAEALGRAGEALRATEGKDPEVLVMVGERALKAAEALWALNDAVGLLEPPWYSAGGWDIGDALDALPVLALAVEGAGRDPHGTISPREVRPESWTELTP